MATHSSILAWRIPMDRGAWRGATVPGVPKRQTQLKWVSLHAYPQCLWNRYFRTCHHQVPRLVSGFLSTRSFFYLLFPLCPSGLSIFLKQTCPVFLSFFLKYLFLAVLGLRGSAWAFSSLMSKASPSWRHAGVSWWWLFLWQTTGSRVSGLQ